jgi:hypothetical protein
MTNTASESFSCTQFPKLIAGQTPLNIASRYNTHAPKALSDGNGDNDRGGNAVDRPESAEGVA